MCIIFLFLLVCRPHSFALYTANRIYELVADNGAEMHMWIGALSPKKFSQGDDDLITNCVYKGQSLQLTTYG